MEGSITKCQQWLVWKERWSQSQDGLSNFIYTFLSQLHLFYDKHFLFLKFKNYALNYSDFLSVSIPCFKSQLYYFSLLFFSSSLLFHFFSFLSPAPGPWICEASTPPLNYNPNPFSFYFETGLLRLALNSLSSCLSPTTYWDCLGSAAFIL